jgi:hypothetical protein
MSSKHESLDFTENKNGFFTTTLSRTCDITIEWTHFYMYMEVACYYDLWWRWWYDILHEWHS